MQLWYIIYIYNMSYIMGSGLISAIVILIDQVFYAPACTLHGLRLYHSWSHSVMKRNSPKNTWLNPVRWYKRGFWIKAISVYMLYFIVSLYLISIKSVSWPLHWIGNRSPWVHHDIFTNLCCKYFADCLLAHIMWLMPCKWALKNDDQIDYLI